MKSSINKKPTKKLKAAFIIFFFILSFQTNLSSTPKNEHLDLGNSSAASIQCVWTGVEKIVAVGDIHGDYDNFVTILKATGIIDEALHWKAGKTHFVQIGDIMDRGNDAKKVFDLIMRLEKEAEQTGGKVHMLIGNHEEMNITGVAFRRIGYVTPKQFASFLPEKYREKKEKEFKKKMEKSVQEGTNSDPSLDISLDKCWDDLKKREGAQKLYTNTFNENYGKWIIKHNAVIKINDIVFVHGGISERFSTKKLEDINNKLREELNIYRIAYKRSQIAIIKPEILYVSDGPLWFRDLAQKDEEAYKEDVVRILKNLDAKHMVIAHTPRIGSKVVASEEEMSRFEGKIWIIDTGISEYYGGSLSALIIEKGKFSVWGKIDEE